MTDVLQRAALRFRPNESCTDCITTSPLRYIGLSADGKHHRFSCCTCRSIVLFDRAAKHFKRDAADVSPIAGGARADVDGSHGESFKKTSPVELMS